jgi:hypothetical protein
VNDAGNEVVRTVRYYIIAVVYRKTANLLNKAKAIPLQAWTDPEVSRRLRLPDFKTIGT